MSAGSLNVRVNFLSHSKKLLQDSNYQDEAAFRDVISKAYYAAYHRAAEYFGKYPTNYDSVHGEMQQFLWNEHNQDRLPKSACTIFRTARTERVNSDYHLNVSIVETDARRQIERIESFFSALKTAEERREQTQPVVKAASLSDLQDKLQASKKTKFDK